ncbi:hypothetical protein D3C80_612680 [compost metagenome]
MVRAVVSLLIAAAFEAVLAATVSIRCPSAESALARVAASAWMAAALLPAEAVTVSIFWLSESSAD